MGKRYFYSIRPKRPANVIYLSERRKRKPVRAFSRHWEEQGLYEPMNKAESNEICRRFGIVRRKQVRALMKMAGFIRAGRADNAKGMVGTCGLTEAHLDAAACHCLRKEISLVRPSEVNFDRVEAMFQPYGIHYRRIHRIATEVFTENSKNEADVLESCRVAIGLGTRELGREGQFPF